MPRDGRSQPQPGTTELYSQDPAQCAGQPSTQDHKANDTYQLHRHLQQSRSAIEEQAYQYNSSRTGESSERPILKTLGNLCTWLNIFWCDASSFCWHARSGLYRSQVQVKSVYISYVYSTPYCLPLCYMDILPLRSGHGCPSYFHQIWVMCQAKGLLCLGM